MAQDSEKQVQDMVETIILNLKKQGVTVDSAAVLNLKKGSNAEVIDKVLKDTMQEVKAVKPEGKLKGQTQKVSAGGQAPYGPDDPCFCPNCFRFDNFEQVLTPLGGEFDYVSFSLLGKVFDLKFHRDAKGRENMMIQEHQTGEVDPNWSAEDIQKALNEAIARKQYDVAQRLLDVLNNRKNQ